MQQFFRYRVTLRRGNSNEQEIAYFADREDVTERTPMKTEKVLGANKCGIFGLLAYKVIKDIIPSSITFDEEVNLPAPQNCEPHVMNEEGYRLLRQENYVDAERQFLQALNLFPDFALAHANLGIVYYQTGRAPDAVTELRKAIALSSTPYRPFLTNLAIACYRAHDYPCAEKANQQAIALDPNLFVSYGNLSVVYRKWEKYDLAEDVLDQGEKILNEAGNSANTNDWYVLYKDRGILAFYMKNPKASAQFLEKADGMGTSFKEEIDYYLAIIYEKQGDKTNACQMWQQYNQVKKSGLFEEVERRSDAAKRMEQLNCS